MYIPDYLVILMWGLLAVLSVLIVLMYRQLAVYLRVHGGPRPAHGPVAGTMLAGFRWTTRDGSEQTFDPNGRPTMLLIADPTCNSCNQALEVLEDLRTDDLVRQVRLLILTKEPRVLVEASPVFSSSSYTIGHIAPRVADLLEAHMSPLAISVGADGRVRTSGAAWRADQFRLFCARAMSDIEDTAESAANEFPIARAGLQA